MFSFSLTQQQIAQFKTFGLVVLQDLLDGLKAAALADAFGEIGPEGPGGIRGDYLPLTLDRAPLNQSLIADDPACSRARPRCSAPRPCRRRRSPPASPATPVGIPTRPGCGRRQVPGAPAVPTADSGAPRVVPAPTCLGPPSGWRRAGRRTSAKSHRPAGSSSGTPRPGPSLNSTGAPDLMGIGTQKEPCDGDEWDGSSCKSCRRDRRRRSRRAGCDPLRSAARP